MASPAEALDLARRYHQSGDFRQAEQLYRQVLQADGHRAQIWYLLAETCQGQGKFADAAGGYQQALRRQPEHIDARVNLGVVLANQRKLDEAIAHFREALRLKCDYPKVHHNLGVALAEQGNLAEAVQSLRQAIRLKPDYAEAGSSLINLQYSFDDANRLTSETDTINGTATTTNYGYDTSNQLTSAGSSSYSFDSNGNRTMTGYQTGAGNMLLSDGTWNYTFDNEGNVIQKVGISNNLKWLYTYDNANHLIQATRYSYSGGAWSLSQQVTYQYDVFGNRVEEDIYTASNNTTVVTKSAYSLASELLQDRGSADGTANAWADLNSSNQLLMRRFYLDDLDSVFARMDSSGNFAWYLPDQLGSIRGLMNNSGSLIDQINYDAWGNISTESSPTSGDRYKSDGGEYSSITGLDHFGARYYDPTAGRWYSQDLLGFDAGDPNLYRYVFNDPTNGTDSTGLCWPLRRRCPPSGPSGGYGQYPDDTGYFDAFGGLLPRPIATLDGKTHYYNAPIGLKTVYTLRNIKSKIRNPSANFFQRLGLGPSAGASARASKIVESLKDEFRKKFPTTFETEAPDGTHFVWQKTSSKNYTLTTSGSVTPATYTIYINITITQYKAVKREQDK